MKNIFSKYRTVITVSLPLVMSMAATTVMEFTDRVFLANYNMDAIAAEPIFKLSGHPPAIQQLEVIYFRTLTQAP